MAKKKATKKALTRKSKKKSSKKKSPSSYGKSNTKKKVSSKRTASDALHVEAPKKLEAKPDFSSFSTHKARASWFNSREAWPMREAPVDLLLKARATSVVTIPPHPGSANWEQSGPTNTGGRMTCIAVDPANANSILAGAAGGGVWTSSDGGDNWTARWHAEPTLNIGSLCLDPADSKIVYCGTGEANLSADSHPGVGLYRSMDFGITWHLLAPAETHKLPRRIGRVSVDPFDSDRILLAGVGHQSSDARGLFVSSDGGISWALIEAMITSPYHCHEVVFHPSVQGTIYATIDANGMQSGIWRSNNGGQSWTHLTSGLPPAPLGRRISLAIAAGNPKVIYAQIANQNGGVLGVFRSANGGNTWNSIGGSHFNRERQMNYNNTIAVDPTDENVVICGGVDLHRTTNGGGSWKKITDWRAERGVDSNYAHADQHAVLFHPNVAGLVYAMNDGGMDVSTNSGGTWKNLSDGLATNMFYDISAAASDRRMYGGGMQDNGTWLTTTGKPDEFFETTGGDGGFCAIDPNDSLHLFTSSQFMRVNRFTSSAGWRRDIGPNETGPRPWMAFIALDPDRPKRVFVGSLRVWRTKTDGPPWSDVSGNLDGSYITCIEISRANTDRIYVGTENGGIFKSEDGGDTWSGNIASSVLPGRTITRLRTPADNADVVYATVANFDNSHLFRSLNGGDTWDDLDAGNLPNAPLHGIAIPSNDSEQLIVGGDAGVFLSQDAGATWHNLTMNLPTVMVVDLVLQESAMSLIAATYGRSTWRMDLSNLA